MTDSVSLPQVVLLASQLPPAERKQLAELILRDLASETQATGTPRRFWREIRDAAAHPLCGEDAQTWVSRGRSEADEHRGDTPKINR